MIIKVFPKGFLFDFDGVVVDSFESHYSAWTLAFKELFDDEIVSFPDSHIGKTPLHIAEYFCKTIGKADRKEELYAAKERYLQTNFTIPKLLPGVQELTKFLSEKNIPYGIASNATREFLKNSIHHLHLNFPLFFGVQDYEKPKPNPEAYITLAKALGFKTNDFREIWVFEDSLTGTKAAKSAGMQPIGILTQCSKEDLKKAGSVLVFPTLLEAFYYLKSNY